MWPMQSSWDACLLLKLRREAQLGAGQEFDHAAGGFCQLDVQGRTFCHNGICQALQRLVVDLPCPLLGLCSVGPRLSWLT